MNNKNQQAHRAYPAPAPAPPQTREIMSVIRQAMAFHQQGQIARAEPLYRAVLENVPGHFDALHMLGVIEYQREHYEDAVRLIGQALRVNLRSASAHSNIGIALNSLKRHEEALASYNRALAIKPDHIEALNNRANALNSLRRHAEALADSDRVLAIMPNCAEALNNRANALKGLDRHAEALASYDRAVAIKPGYAEALNSRGNALSELKRHDEALASYDRALAINPGYVDALNNRGNALKNLKRHAEALASYDRALAIRPDDAEALSNRGNVLNSLKRHDEALASYDRALAIKPDFVEALNNRCNALSGLNRHEEALASGERALALRPDYVEALNNRGNALNCFKLHEEALASYGRALAINPGYVEALNNRGDTLAQLRRHEEAAEDFDRLLGLETDYKYARGRRLHSRMHCCDWNSFDADAARAATDVQAGRHSTMPFGLLAVSRSPADQLHCARLWVRDRCPPSASSVWQGERYRHDRIRIAYLSADFHDHATAWLMAGLFELHDRERFETIALSFGPDSAGEMRTRLEAAFDRFIDIRPKSDREVAAMMRALEVDIAVDLNGFTADARTGIFALRPAPIQVNYLGYPGTMGADYIDYILADRWVISEADQQHYAEKIVYLPDTYQVNDRKRRIGERTPARAALGLPETGFVFCSFNNNYKITPFMFDIWMRLLHQVEGSVLWLLEGNAAVVRNLRREAEKRRVAPDRLVFAPRMKLEDHLARHRRADLFLDTLPYNAHTTASDALWAGLPLVTCLGSTFAGRVAASLLDAVGLPELIARSLEDYEALALALANDRTRLASLKSRLAQNRETFPLFDTDRFRRHIESAYATMWQRHQRGEPPAGFAVAPEPRQ